MLLLWEEFVHFSEGNFCVWKVYVVGMTSKVCVRLQLQVFFLWQNCEITRPFDESLNSIFQHS